MLAAAALLLLPWLFRLDGKPHSDWQQFLGRFHPLVVHLPIGLILLVPLLEVAGRARPALREAAGCVLSLSIFACLAAVALGCLLAYGSGEKGSGVSRHMWGGIALTIVVMLCFLARPSWTLRTQVVALYPALLIAALGLLAWTAHQGGSLTHGANYLTEYLPAPLKHLGFPGVASAEAAVPPDSFYAQQIHPVLDAKCVACHSQAKVKGGLRLDSYSSLMRGGKEGAVIVPGQPDKSILLQRVTLPPSHKLFMPAEGKPPLSPEQIAMIRAWIAQGASSTDTTVAGVVVRQQEAPPPPVGDYSRLMPEIAQTAKAAVVRITPVSQNPADGLILNAIDATPGFNDSQLAQFAKFAPYIVEIELGRTAVTDASFDTLRKFTNLRALHLENTAVTGAGIQKLAPLTHLTYLNLSGTKATQATIAPLKEMKHIHHLYLYNTPAQPLVETPANTTTARKSG
jgi:uncharacterized membrane protein